MPVLASGYFKCLDVKLCLFLSLQDAKSFGTILPTFLPVWIGLATSRNRKMPIRIEALKCIKVFFVVSKWAFLFPFNKIELCLDHLVFLFWLLGPAFWLRRIFVRILRNRSLILQVSNIKQMLKLSLESRKSRERENCLIYNVFVLKGFVQERPARSR